MTSTVELDIPAVGLDWYIPVTSINESVCDAWSTTISRLFMIEIGLVELDAGTAYKQALDPSYS